MPSLFQTLGGTIVNFILQGTLKDPRWIEPQLPTLMDQLDNILLY